MVRDNSKFNKNPYHVPFDNFTLSDLSGGREQFGDKIKSKLVIRVA